MSKVIFSQISNQSGMKGMKLYKKFYGAVFFKYFNKLYLVEYKVTEMYLYTFKK